MTQLDALRLAGEVRDRLVEFALDTNRTSDARLAKICRAIWSGPQDTGGLVGDLWVEGAFPSATAQSTLGSMARAHLFDPALQRYLDHPDRMPGERQLYAHQDAAIRAAKGQGTQGERPALVVTAGTGAGKTESFLLPLLDDLARHPRGAEAGVRCIILYPMNALVNDQVDRLYKWLRDQTAISLFHFTSETPEDCKRANDDGVPRWAPCRMRTRQEARGLETHDGRKVEPSARRAVPDILITNYSMLEYMLCRPQDAVFFGPALRTIVLDEAHLYTGTLAAEITLLLRRLFLRCGRTPDQVLQIATSATLGTGDQDELREYAATIFSKLPRQVRVIEGRTADPALDDPAPPAVPATAETLAHLPWPDQPLLVADTTGETSLLRDSALCARLREGLLPQVVAPSWLARIDAALDTPATVLQKALSAAPVTRELDAQLRRRRHLPLAELAEGLWGSSDATAVRATLVLLRLAASARPAAGEYPLVPHRIHLLARPSEGLTICLNERCNGTAERRLPPFGLVQAGTTDHCGACGSATLPLGRCADCGEWLVAAIHQGSRLLPLTPGSDKRELFTARADVSGVEVVVVEPARAEISGAGAHGVRLARIESCPACGAEPVDWQPFASGTPLTLAILTETVLAGLPELPSPHNCYLPARGRRLLAFSDSRQEAARLGPRLTYQHEIQLVRAAIVQLLGRDAVSDDAVLEEIRDEIAELSEDLTAHGLTPAQRQRKESKLADLRQELEQHTVGGSIGEWAAALAREPRLEQVLDSDIGLKQRAFDPQRQPPEWSKIEWDQNAERVRERATLFLGREFASPNPNANYAESLGFGEVTYPGLAALSAPDAVLGRLPTESSRQALEACWPALLAALCDTLRRDGAITLGRDDLDRAYSFNNIPLGRRAVRDTDKGYGLVRFVGETERQRRRRFVVAVLQQCGLAAGEATAIAPEVLGAAFDQLLERAARADAINRAGALPWLERTEEQLKDRSQVEAIRLRFPELGLRRPHTLYRSKLTRHIWPRSVLGCAPETGIDATLEPMSDADLDRDPRLARQRREYLHSHVFTMGLWASEHSAQLSPKENRRLQDLFKIGARNILSATTTLELGIDIGGLNGVLLSNVPPGKANYLQRAGRAGRRADGSSVVVTFARPRPFDQAVFGAFGAFLGRPLRRPLVFLDRERVVRRHLHALLLNSFFAEIREPSERVGAMLAFGRMGHFLGVEIAHRWDSSQKPAEPGRTTYSVQGADRLPWWRPVADAPSLADQFAGYLTWLQHDGQATIRSQADDLLRSTCSQGITSRWQDLLGTVAATFSAAIESWQGEYDELHMAWCAAETRPQANAIRYQMQALCELTVIEALADRQFLPHYGFPIGLQRLKVIAPDEEQPGHMREEDQYRLERSSLLALQEYVPGSQLLVGGKLITSHGLLKHWTGATINNYLGSRYQCRTCINDHFSYAPIGTSDTCPVCHEAFKTSPTDVLFPKHGFTTAAWDPPKWSTDVERVGTANTATMTFTHSALRDAAVTAVRALAGVAGLLALYREDGELLVYNRGDDNKGFVICLGCGYAQSEQHVDSGVMRLPRGFEWHAPLTKIKASQICRTPGNTAMAPLRNQILAAREVTDVLLVDFSGALGAQAADLALITTLGFALQRAGAQLLQLDTRELGVMTVPAGERGTSWGAVLYDNVPGGAGHVRELIGGGTDQPDGLARAWFACAREILYVDEQHHAQCETACLRCLLAFDAQDAMARRLLQRRAALAVLDQLLGQSDQPLSTPVATGNDHAGDRRTSQSGRPSAQERLQRALHQQARRR